MRSFSLSDETGLEPVRQGKGKSDFYETERDHRQEWISYFLQYGLPPMRWAQSGIYCT